MNTERLPLALAAALLLAGCAQDWSPRAGTIDAADFGEANRQTFAAMVIDPDPLYEEPLAASGEHAADAIERYRTDRVKQPESIRTGVLTGGGASSGSSAPGGN